jgi:rare lipoprotein A
MPGLLGYGNHGPMRTLRTSNAAIALGLLLVSAPLAGCALPVPFADWPLAIERGEASYYAGEFHGRTAASGERFNMYQLTAAHRTLPMGTRVRVTNLRNGRDVVVRINDRGPFVQGRVIDLSYAAAKKVDMVTAGVVPVKLEILR